MRAECTSETFFVCLNARGRCEQIRSGVARCIPASPRRVRVRGVGGQLSALSVGRHIRARTARQGLWVWYAEESLIRHT